MDVLSDPKDPSDVDDVSWDWTANLGAETVASHVVKAFPSSLTIDSSAEDAGVVSARVSGGVNGQAYELTCRIVTSGGRVLERSAILQVVQR